MRLVPLAILLAPSLAFARPSKLSIDVNGGMLTLTFDPAKVSEAEVRAAVELSPQTSPDGVTIEFLESCRDASGNTMPCNGPHTPTQPQYLVDGDVVIAKNKAIVKAAADRKVAKELEPARDYLRRQTAFYAGLEERKLAYYKSWKTADLAPPIEGVDGTKVCAVIIAKLDATTAHADKYKLASHEWHNCINDLGHKQFGDYPEAPFKAFLKAKGVTTKFAPQIGD